MHDIPKWIQFIYGIDLIYGKISIFIISISNCSKCWKIWWNYGFLPILDINKYIHEWGCVILCESYTKSRYVSKTEWMWMRNQFSKWGDCCCVYYSLTDSSLEFLLHFHFSSIKNLLMNSGYKWGYKSIHYYHLTEFI